MDPACKWFIGVLIGIIMGMGAYIARQHQSEKGTLRAWLKSLQDQLSMANLVETESDPKNPKGGA